MLSLFGKYLRRKDGGVTTQAAFMIPLVVLLTGGAIETAYTYYQWNGAMQAARQGARIAATSNPVASNLRTMTGLGNGVEAGDPMPDYERDCSGKDKTCSGSAYDANAMNAIVFGPDLDMSCAATQKERRGMCDLFGDVTVDNVKVSYTGSGLGRAGFPADPAPFITVTLTDLEYDFIFLDLIAPQGLKSIPDVRVSLMGEDIRSG